MTHPDFTDKDIERFWSRVHVAGPDDCWEWQAGKIGAGYGSLTIEGQRVYSHRLAIHIFTGIDPDKNCVCHHCDNPPCCNPKHLFVGTHAANMKDAQRKGRTSDPPDTGKSRRQITMSQAGEIRQRYHAGESMPQLGKMFGLTWASIRTILDNESYHDPDYTRTRFRDRRKRNKWLVDRLPSEPGDSIHPENYVSKSIHEL